MSEVNNDFFPQLQSQTQFNTQHTAHTFRERFIFFATIFTVSYIAIMILILYRKFNNKPRLSAKQKVTQVFLAFIPLALLAIVIVVLYFNAVSQFTF